jgi:hypothetical protein
MTTQTKARITLVTLGLLVLAALMYGVGVIPVLQGVAGFAGTILLGVLFVWAAENANWSCLKR